MSRQLVQFLSLHIRSRSRGRKIMPTFLKIDVEGYEYQVLEGSRSILATTPAVFVEVHTLTLPRYGKNLKICGNS